jgi:pyrimidine operon attenuation protein/uracil phosphoribosyltransferase
MAPSRKATIAKATTAAKAKTVKSSTTKNVPKKGVPKKGDAKQVTAKQPKKAANSSSVRVCTADEMAAGITSIARHISREFPDSSSVVLLGIRTRGVIIAERLRTLLEKTYGKSVAAGVLDITLYRDDLSSLGPQPMVRDSEIPFDVTDANVIIVDDVVYTGRTIRAAMDEIIDFGRPRRIRLAVLVDRGCREYPIQPDYIGKKIPTTEDQSVRVCLADIDDTEEIVLDG